MSPDPAARAAHRLLCGRLAGLLFLAGSLSGVPVNQLLVPAVDGRAHFTTGVGIVSGLICLALPWDRLSQRWLHVLAVVASLEVGLAMWGAGVHASVYLWFLVFIVVFWGFAIEWRPVAALHLVVVGAVALYPVLTASEDHRANVLAETLVCLPILFVAAGAVVYLRERLTVAIAALGDAAYADPLTGAANRRVQDDVLAYELTRHRRNGSPLSVVVLDLDRFKHVNDTLGHAAGDRLLCDVVRVLRETVRDQDTVIRQGGDEFCIIAPETDRDDADALVARIKEGLATLVADGEPLSTSAGAATFPADATSGEMLLAQADSRQRDDKAAHRAVARVPQLVR